MSIGYDLEMIRNQNQSQFLWAESILFGFLASVRLLNIEAQFSPDWINHLWLIGYVGTYFREHHHFPVLINTSEYIGIPILTFYGFGFYRLFGFLSGFVPAGILIRLCILGIYFLQHFTVVQTLTRMRQSRLFASSVALTITLSVYPLTNLYNRGALTEFFATVSLVLALCFLVQAFLESKRPVQWKNWLKFTLFFLFVVLSHPITALFGSVFLILFLIFFISLNQDLFRKSRQWVKCFAMSGFLCFVFASPWLYCVQEFTGKSIFITKPRIFYFVDSIDWIWSRISPIPFDRRVFFHPMDQISTPYLEAPTNIFILALFILFFVYLSKSPVFKRRVKNQANRRGRAIRLYFFLMSLIWLIFLVLSINSKAGHQLPTVFTKIQFAYRFVTYQGLTAFCGILGLAFYCRDDGIVYRGKREVLGIVGLALLAFFVKLAHVVPLKEMGQGLPTSPEYRDRLLHLPVTFYALNSYAAFNQYQEIGEDQISLSEKLLLRPAREEAFGTVQSVDLNIPLSGWYLTNVLAFPWSRFKVNDQEATDLRAIRDHGAPVLVLFLSKGRNKITYDVVPDPVWDRLDFCSSIFGSIFLLLGLFWIRSGRKLR